MAPARFSDDPAREGRGELRNHSRCFSGIYSIGSEQIGEEIVVTFEPPRRDLGESVVRVRMKRVPEVYRELFTLVLVMAAFLVAFALAFPTKY
jgi:hypothetical protein